MEFSKLVLLSGLLGEEQSIVIAPITSKQPMPTNPYSRSKELLVNAFSCSTYQRLDRAFSTSGLQHMEKPSQYLARFNLLLQEATMDDVRQWIRDESFARGCTTNSDK